MLRFFCLIGALLALAGCASNSNNASTAQIAAVSYRQAGPATISLYTMVSNRTGAGGHSALLINASERVFFDPAGSFYLDIVPERNDVLYGITPRIEQAYRSAHARSTYHVMIQTVEVSPAVAEQALRLAQQAGPVSAMFCTSSTSQLLSQLPGFEGVGSTFYPVKLADKFARLPGVSTEKYYEDDSSDLDKALADGNAALSEG